MASSATRPAMCLPRSVTGSSDRARSPRPPRGDSMPGIRAFLPGMSTGHAPGGYGGWPPREAAASARRLPHVPDAAYRVDERVAARVDLLAQVADVQLDHVRLAAEVVVPDPVQDLRLGQHPARVAHHEAQQLELGGGQVDQVAGPAHLARVLVHGEVRDDQ